MIKAATPAAMPDRKHDDDIFAGEGYDLFRPTKDAPRSPLAFMFAQRANWMLRAHFHDQHQFQEVARGSGTLGKHALAPFAIHYTSPESAYGPIIANPEGLAYFTLRATQQAVENPPLVKILYFVNIIGLSELRSRRAPRASARSLVGIDQIAFAVHAAPRKANLGDASGIRAMRTMLVVNMFSLNCCSTPRMPRNIVCRIRPTVIAQPKRSSMRLRIRWLTRYPR